MADDRRPYRREPQERRRESLIAAALDLMAEGGPQAATVRAIAERAGITAGLIRHYFQSKDDLTRAAYAVVMNRMTTESLAATEGIDADPAARLVAFVVASLRPPIMDGERVRLWAGFLHHVRRDPNMRDVHETTYLAYRDRLQALIQDLPGKSDPAEARALAIACNAVIDGLWLEGGTLPLSFDEGEVERIGLAAVAAILNTSLPAPRPAHRSLEVL
ncbi:MAG: TetR/AcrR family transcriptional regulator [Paracoccaceae bacterium]